MTIGSITVWYRTDHNTLFMHIHMLLPVRGVRKPLIAVRLKTRKRLLSGVHAHVDFQIFASSKGLAAPRCLTYKRFFTYDKNVNKGYEIKIYMKYTNFRQRMARKYKNYLCEFSND